MAQARGSTTNLTLAQRVLDIITAESKLFTTSFAWQQYTVHEDLGVGYRSLGRIRGCRQDVSVK